MAEFRKKTSSNKGMSIMELLLVMAISLMILTMVVISYNVVNNANTTKAAKRLENVLKTARVAAMSRGQDAGVVKLSTENGRLFAYVGEGAAAAKKELICNANVAVSVSDVEGVAPPIADTPTDGTVYVSFNTNGRIRESRTDAYYFILARGEKAYKVVVSKYTGAVECGLYTPGGGDGEGEGEGEEG
ncbi:MAG: GspH/FimT family protein [Lachnospiraceae bacterium]|nr:GspH/FimT family protein [Lachnospiraceae bacterium]